ncbi:uncharacterized protein LOC116257929 [Nymphaea colorata]|nr:uncharacterized protein LOC116257929 [Nymphaea colorata]
MAFSVRHLLSPTSVSAVYLGPLPVIGLPLHCHLHMSDLRYGGLIKILNCTYQTQPKDTRPRQGNGSGYGALGTNQQGKDCSIEKIQEEVSKETRESSDEY